MIIRHYVVDYPIRKEAIPFAKNMFALPISTLW
jgi:hypothetical protein